MSKAKPNITSGSTTQRDLLHFALNPPPTPAIKFVDAIRVATRIPNWGMQSIENAIKDALAGNRKPSALRTETIPVVVRASAESRVLENALKCFKLIDREATLEFTPETLRIAAVNGEHTMLCRTTLHRTGFTTYTTEGTTTTFHAEIKPLVAALTRAGKEKGRDISIRVGKDGGALAIGFLVGSGMKHIIALKRPKFVPPIESELHTYSRAKQPCTASVEKAELIQALQDADLTASLVRITIAGSRMHLAAVDEATECGASIPLVSCEGAPDGLECGLFSARDLAKAAKTLGAFKIPTITIFAGSVIPITMRAETETMALEFMLAPHVESDGLPSPI